MKLMTVAPRITNTASQQRSERLRTAVMFPGQGAQHPRMGTDLYGRSPTFTATMDSAFELLGAEGRDIREDWLAERPSDLFDDGSRSQPLLFAVNCALGRTLLAAGVRVDVYLGHSVGELAAATMAGVFDFRTGLDLLREIMHLYRHSRPGGMLMVAATADEVGPYLRDGVVVGAVNAARQIMVAGCDPALGQVERELVRDGFVCTRARARQPFHSPGMRLDPGQRSRIAASIAPRAPRQQIYSAYTGKALDDTTAKDPNFWLDHPTAPVLFGPTLRGLLDTGPHLLVEAGPGQSLTMLARRVRDVRSGRSHALALLPPERQRPGSDLDSFRGTFARIGELCDLSADAALDF